MGSILTCTMITCTAGSFRLWPIIIYWRTSISQPSSTLQVNVGWPRWRCTILTITYRRGSTNNDADGLSRLSSKQTVPPDLLTLLHFQISTGVRHSAAIQLSQSLSGICVMARDLIKYARGLGQAVASRQRTVSSVYNIRMPFAFPVSVSCENLYL